MATAIVARIWLIHLMSMCFRYMGIPLRSHARVGSGHLFRNLTNQGKDLRTPKSEGGIEGVSYPIVADMTKSIAQDYDVLKDDLGVAYRGLFLIDKEGIVRHQVVNDLPLGRSVDETLRMVDALQFFEENGEVCPANWQAGEKAMTPTQDGLELFFAG